MSVSGNVTQIFAALTAWSFVLAVVPETLPPATGGLLRLHVGDGPETASGVLPLGAIVPEVRGTRAAPSWHVEHREARLEAVFESGGARIEPLTSRPWSWSAELVRWGRGRECAPVPEVDHELASGAWFERRRGPIVEWFHSGEAALEQGFSLEESAAGPVEEPLTLTLALETELVGEVSEDGLAIVFQDPCSSERMTYAGLHVEDCTGRELDARLALADGELSILVDDRGASYPLSIDPTCTVLTDELLPPDGISRYFGAAVAMDGDTLAVSRPGPGRLRVFVFRGEPGAWSLEASIELSSGMDRSGAVDLEGDRLVVGLPHGSSGGRVEVYERSGASWSLAETLAPPELELWDRFGITVALDDETLVVASPGDDDLAQNAGALYVFDRGPGSWNLSQKVTTLDAAQGDSLGRSFTGSVSYAANALDIEGDRIVAGTTKQDEAGFQAGAVYMFTRSAGVWTQEQKLLSPAPAHYEHFGSAVDLEDDQLVVGQPSSDGWGGGNGEAFIYGLRDAVWSFDQELPFSNMNTGMYFGMSVDIEGDHVAVGAPGLAAGFPGQPTGEVAFYSRCANEWIEGTLQPATAGERERFGWDLDLEAEALAVGAPYRESTGVLSGSTYVYSVEERFQTYCVAAPNSVGSGANIGALGCNVVDSNSFALTVSGAAPLQPGIFYFGDTQTQVPLGNGLRCVGGMTFRLNPPLVLSASGEATRPVDLTSFPAAGLIVPGSLWFFQFWYRDPAFGGPGFNLSDGLRVEWK